MTKKGPPKVFCLLCDQGFGSNDHLGRHLQHIHAMCFADYDWHHVQNNVGPPRCANCGRRPSQHSGHYQNFCSKECKDAGHVLSDDGRARVARSAQLVGESNRTHGESFPPTPEYLTYHAMLQRCLNPDHQSYSGYGGRGITVCKRWLGKNGFHHFLVDMGRRPSKKHSLDRIDNDGRYTPKNCRWATRTQQQRNRRCSIRRFEGQPELKGHA